MINISAARARSPSAALLFSNLLSVLIVINRLKNLPPNLTEVESKPYVQKLPGCYATQASLAIVLQMGPFSGESENGCPRAHI